MGEARIEPEAGITIGRSHGQDAANYAEVYGAEGPRIVMAERMATHYHAERPTYRASYREAFLAGWTEYVYGSARPWSTDGVRALRDEARATGDPHDPWCDVMSWSFAVARVLSAIDPDSVPASWEYRRSPGDNLTVREIANEDDEPWEDVVTANLYREGAVTVDDLRWWGAVMTRRAAWVRAAGRDY